MLGSWPKEIGTVYRDASGLRVVGTLNELYAWSHRPGAIWPCSTLEDYDRVSAVLDIEYGDLVDLIVYDDIESRHPLDSDDIDIDGNELTAWLDDCLAGTPFAYLARSKDNSDV